MRFDNTHDIGRVFGLATGDHLPFREGEAISLLTQIQGVLGDAASSPEDRLKRVDVIVNSAAPSNGSLRARRLDREQHRVRGGLAPWQVTRLRRFISESFPDAIRGADLARLVCLSPHHFCRAFRVSFNVTPHAFIMRKRIERACLLMKSSRATLGEIAIDCGFADQAHFNRLFRKYLNCSPGVWRRMDAGLSTTGSAPKRD